MRKTKIPLWERAQSSHSASGTPDAISGQSGKLRQDAATMMKYSCLPTGNLECFSAVRPELSGKARFFRSLWAGRRCAAGRFSFSKVKRSNRLRGMRAERLPPVFALSCSEQRGRRRLSMIAFYGLTVCCLSEKGREEQLILSYSSL